MKKVIRHALGIKPHTGWAACVIVGGTADEPEIVANEVIRFSDDPQRFCYHAAAEMELEAAGQWLTTVKRLAVANARIALQPLLAEADICMIAARDREPGPLEYIFAAHPRIHTAEGCFYRDVLRQACTIPVELVSPASLDPGKLGRLSTSPWGRDQKIAALAGWAILERDFV